MRKIKSEFVLAALLLLVALTGTGCLLFAAGAGAGAGAAGYAYVKGELKTTEPVSIDRTWDATVAGVQEMNLPIINQSHDALQGHLVAKTSGDKNVDINLKKIADTSTELRVRVGTFGDEALSRTILDAINRHLNTPPAVGGSYR